MPTKFGHRKGNPRVRLTDRDIEDEQFAKCAISDAANQTPFTDKLTDSLKFVSVDR
jgi:hypothetical protein